MPEVLFMSWPLSRVTYKKETSPIDQIKNFELLIPFSEYANFNRYFISIYSNH